ncbi:MFS transporter [Pseudomonas cremoricolorata]|uniref:MFS transporter n=1 Tax=Pseudomonas cremoricolorata TaxID=157783 RepID=UPI00040FB5DE|nr:MFS transporter [Pseudomonas cremoricolorata]
MRTLPTPLIFIGTLLTASGYGATFLIAAWFDSQGASELLAGRTLGMALFGTLLGVPLVGWFAGKVDAARLAACGALVIAGGYAVFTALPHASSLLPSLACALIGLGWGMFYLGAPMALSERIDDHQRGPVFTRFSAFQMSGICGGPVLLALAMAHSSMSLNSVFLGVSIIALLASLLLTCFAHRSPQPSTAAALRPWLRSISRLSRTVAIRPIIMAGLGGAVFSGMMAFQSSLTTGTTSQPSTFFAIHALTAVITRLLLAKHLSSWPRTPLMTTLLLCLMGGLLCLLGLPVHAGFHIAAAALTGAGYGLLYPVIQTWAVNASHPGDRHGALTWFVLAYFIGIFGFPPLGGWLLVTVGKTGFVYALALLAALELGLGLMRNESHHGPC